MISQIINVHTGLSEDIYGGWLSRGLGAHFHFLFSFIGGGEVGGKSRQHSIWDVWFLCHVIASTWWGLLEAQKRFEYERTCFPLLPADYFRKKGKGLSGGFSIFVTALKVFFTNSTKRKNLWDLLFLGGKICVTFLNSCFSYHIFVFAHYLPPSPPHFTQD